MSAAFSTALSNSIERLVDIRTHELHESTKHIPHIKHKLPPPPCLGFPSQSSFSFTQRLKIQETACHDWTGHGKKAVIFVGEVMENARIRFQGH